MYTYVILEFSANELCSIVASCIKKDYKFIIKVTDVFLIPSVFHFFKMKMEIKIMGPVLLLWYDSHVIRNDCVFSGYYTFYHQSSYSEFHSILNIVNQKVIV